MMRLPMYCSAVLSKSYVLSCYLLIPRFQGNNIIIIYMKNSDAYTPSNYCRKSTNFEEEWLYKIPRATPNYCIFDKTVGITCYFDVGIISNQQFSQERESFHTEIRRKHCKFTKNHGNYCFNIASITPPQKKRVYIGLDINGSTIISRELWDNAFTFVKIITTWVKLEYRWGIRGCGWKVHRLMTKKELCHSNKTWHALNSTFPDTNCIVSFQINQHWISNSGLWKVVLETFRERLAKLTIFFLIFVLMLGNRK